MITDLALILGTAAIVTLIFKKWQQPLVLGYLVAGFLVGPHCLFYSTAIDVKSIQLWSEMGVIFLLFALGLEFSFKKLLRVLPTAGPIAIFEISFMLGIGFLTAQILGWNFMDSLFLGGIISISSTSVILRTIEELNLKHKKFVGTVFGILVIEDLMAVLLLVLLSTVALTRQFAGFEMLTSLLKLAFFLLIWFLTGVFLLPTLLRRSQKLLTEETVLVIAVALCLGMVVFASAVGFSAALGAFVTGSLLAETIEAQRIHHLIKPIRDLFSAVFFVSVGMLIDPITIALHGSLIVLISLVVIFGKSLAVTAGSLMMGTGLKQSVQTGMTFAQIGEFSFIIATLGLSFKVISEEIYPVAVAVSVVTTFSTPYLMRSSERVSRFVKNILPARWLQSIEEPAPAKPPSVRGAWRKIFADLFLKVLLNGVVAVAIFLLGARVVWPWMIEKSLNELMAQGVSLLLSFGLSAPFLWAVAFSRGREKGPWIFFQALRPLLSLLLATILVNLFLPGLEALAFAFVGMLLLSFIFFKPLQKIYFFVETRFIENLNHPSPEEASAPTEKKGLAPWNAHLTEYLIPPEASYVGKPLHELALRERYGVTVALIERGRKRLTAPGRFEQLMPADRIFVIGTDEQLEKFRDFIHPTEAKANGGVETDAFALEQLHLQVGSPYIDKNIRLSGLREATDGLVVGIERQGQRILNPDSSLVLQAGDVLWIVGNRSKILAGGWA